MDEDIFNLEIRKFLKKVGITSQREIEKAVRDAVSAKKITGEETLNISATLKLDKINLEETAYLSGTERQRKIKVLKFLILRQESVSTVCRTQNGKVNIKNSCFAIIIYSLSLEINSTKLHGLCLISS